MRTAIFFLVLSMLLSNCDSPYDENLAITDLSNIPKGALISTRFDSFDSLKKVIHIEYQKGYYPSVLLSHSSNGKEVTSILKVGINQTEITEARDGNFFDKAWVGLNAPFVVAERKDFSKVAILARRVYAVFGEGDVAFYDFAETMLQNIDEEDLINANSKDLSEKGYINTFNHINAQAFITSIFSEKLANFIADAHERAHMPELISGAFTTEQINDLNNGPVDNYVDIINNEWGQDLGKLLKRKYGIHRHIKWTPSLLANYLNDLQKYYSSVFQIGFHPYRPTDRVVMRFSKKLNIVMHDMIDKTPNLR